MLDLPEIRISRRDPIGMISLRCDLAAEQLEPALRRAVSADVPGMRRITFASDGDIAWMSPDELLIFAPSERVGEVMTIVAEALATIHHLVVDVSDARSVFRLAGPIARAILASGAPVDLAPTAFGQGDFRRTRLGQVPVAFWMVAPDVFDLMCFRSVGGFVAEWLAFAARSEGTPLS